MKVVLKESPNTEAVWIFAATRDVVLLGEPLVLQWKLGLDMSPNIHFLASDSSKCGGPFSPNVPQVH
jgi:hypothetical protein